MRGNMAERLTREHACSSDNHMYVLPSNMIPRRVWSPCIFGLRLRRSDAWPKTSIEGPPLPFLSLAAACASADFLWGQRHALFTAGVSRTRSQRRQCYPPDQGLMHSSVRANTSVGPSKMLRKRIGPTWNGPSEKGGQENCRLTWQHLRSTSRRSSAA